MLHLYTNIEACTRRMQWMRWRSLLVAEMDKYWKEEAKSGQWHFTQQSTQNLKNFGVEGSGKLTKNS